MTTNCTPTREDRQQRQLAISHVMLQHGGELQRQLTIAQVMLERGTDQIAAVSARLRDHDESLDDELESALYFLYIAYEEIEELLD